MAFGLSAAAIGGIAAAVGGVGSALISSNASSKASAAQTAAADAGVQVQQNALDSQNQHFDAISNLLSPYISSGNNANTAAGNLAGANGAGPQAQAIAGIQNGPVFQGENKLGQDAILQNAAATGGLRGGNVQGALAQFSPALLNSLINQQYGQLAGLSSTGAQAGVGLGGVSSQFANVGANTSNSIGTLLNTAGAAQAGGIISGANAINSGISSAVGGLGYALGSSPGASLSGLNSLFSSGFRGF